MSEEPELLWRPTPERAARSTLARYMRWLQDERGLAFADYAELWKWSVDELEEFWASLVEFFEVRFSEGGDTVLGERSMPGAQWFPGARCSFAEHVFRGKRDEDVAIRHASELRPPRLVDLGTAARRDRGDRRRAARLRRGRGRPGGRLHAEHPRDGGGVPGVRVDRSDVVLGRAGVRRAQRDRPLRPDRAEGAAGDRRLPLRRQGLRPQRDRGTDRRRDPGARARRALRLPRRDRLGGRVPRDRASELSFAAVPFDHPLWVLYSSGTTGLPKPIVHGQGGILLEQVKNAHLHLDAQPGDRVVLVLDDRLDDVELPGRGAADRGLDRAVRRQSRPSAIWTRCGIWRRTPESPRSGPARRSSRPA